MNTVELLDHRVLNKILTLIESRNLSYEEFCKDIHIKLQIFKHWQQHKSNEYMNMLDEISIYFEVTVDYLLGKNHRYTEELIYDNTATNDLYILKVLKVLKNLSPDNREIALSHLDYINDKKRKK